MKLCVALLWQLECAMHTWISAILNPTKAIAVVKNCLEGDHSQTAEQYATGHLPLLGIYAAPSCDGIRHSVSLDTE